MAEGRDENSQAPVLASQVQMDGHESFESDGVSSPVAIVDLGLGGGIDKRGGEYCVQSDLTIVVIRAMLLFEEHMNLDGVSCTEKGK
jgi:hypothetical protein